MPAGTKAEHWQVYLSSLLVYPSMLTLPTPGDLRKVNAALSRLLPTGRWASWSVVCGIAVLYRVRGAPRLPEAIMRSAHLLAWLRDGAIPPRCRGHEAIRLLLHCRRWAASLISWYPAGHEAVEERLRSRN